MRHILSAEQGASPSPNVSFVTWYPSCRRSDALAHWLGGASHLIHFFEFKRPIYAPLKYPLQALATFKQLRRSRPDVVFVASPPVFAVLTVWLYAKLFRVPYIVDAHTGVFDDPRWTWLWRLSRFLSRSALATAVTSALMAARVRSWGGRAIVIGDVPVTFPHAKTADLGAGFHVVVINTFSQDEPLAEIIEAARVVPDACFHVTGNPRHSRNTWRGTLPPNVRFTGWLSDEAYAGLLRASDVIVCLTTHDHTMQRGGYEAMAIEKPLITSDWPLLRETFALGTLHVDNSPSAIAAAVSRVRNEAGALAEEMRRLRRERGARFHNVIASVHHLIQERVASL